jgi:hypothetical protein
MVLAEIEGDQHWDELFSCSPYSLAKLAASAMTGFRAGEKSM